MRALLASHAAGRWASVLIFLLAFPFAVPALQAQPTTSLPPFSRLVFEAGASVDAAQTRFDSFYHAGPSADLSAATPFYRGIIGADAGLRRYVARDGQASEDFWAVPIALRWRASLPLLSPRLRLEVGPRLGAMVMRFSGGSPGLRNESELLLGGDAGLSLRFSEHWAGAVGIRYEHIYFSTGVDSWRAYAGLRWRFAAPSWLQTLLR